MVIVLIFSGQMGDTRYGMWYLRGLNNIPQHFIEGVIIILNETFSQIAFCKY